MLKTRIVKDIVKYVNYPIIEISSSEAIKRKMTIDEDSVNGFADAIKNGKSIIFIDEINSFAGYKKYCYEVLENLKEKKILMHELDQIKKLDDIIVIATANKRSYLDDAILRSGRFDRQVFLLILMRKIEEKLLNITLKMLNLQKSLNFRTNRDDSWIFLC